MQRTTSSHPLFFAAALALAAIVLPSTFALAEHHEKGDVAAEIKARIMADHAYLREHLEDKPGGTSRHGSLEFWSSGGLIQSLAADAPPGQYESFALTPKHIKVIALPGGEAAVAMYYLEGSMHPKGRAPVGHYLTRVTQVFVKEDGEWKERAGHWSAIGGGAGTSQAATE